MPVRNASPDDLGAVGAMIVEHAEHEGAAGQVRFDAGSLADAIFGPDPVLGALISHLAGSPGTPAGFALWYPTFSSWASSRGVWLEDLYVRPEHRRQGLGRELLMALREMTTGRVEWDVFDSNEDAKRFYIGLGARPIEHWTRFRWTLE